MSAPTQQDRRELAGQTLTWERLPQRLSEQLKESGQWTRWAEAEPAISWPPSLEAAIIACPERSGADAYLLLAALAKRGSRRGDDDDDAALAVVLLLERGVWRLASQLADVCGVEEVRAAVWEEVKSAEPWLGCRAPRFLIKRAKQRLLRSAARGTADFQVSLDQLLAVDGEEGYLVSASDSCDSRQELRDLLDWARASGALAAHETEFLVELTAVAEVVADGAAAIEMSARHGVSPRTIRRRKAAVLNRLREAVPDYLAATA